MDILNCVAFCARKGESVMNRIHHMQKHFKHPYIPGHYSQKILNLNANSMCFIDI